MDELTTLDLELWMLARGWLLDVPNDVWVLIAPRAVTLVCSGDLVKAIRRDVAVTYLGNLPVTWVN